VFAPTDEAFAKLPAGTVENLLLPQNKDELVKILTYHVVPGKVKAADVVKLDSAETANGSNVRIRVEGETVFVSAARVVATDIGASNGVIHVVDTDGIAALRHPAMTSSDRLCRGHPICGDASGPRKQADRLDLPLR